MKPQKPCCRRIRFRMRMLLIVITIMAVPFGWGGWRLEQVRRERTTITWIEEMGGVAQSRWRLNDFTEFPIGISEWEKSTENWFGERVREVSLRRSPLVSDLSPLAELKNLTWLFLNSTQVNDLSPLAELKNLEHLHLNNTQVSDLSPLVELKNLEHLYLDNTLVSDEQVQELSQALPDCEIHQSIRVENN